MSAPESPSGPASIFTGAWAPDRLIDDRFQVVRELGSGGMGAVYVVFDRVVLDRRGRPSDVSIVGRKPDPLAHCAAAAVRDLSFPPGTPSPLYHTLPPRTRP